MLPGTWSMMPAGLSLNFSEAGAKIPHQGEDMSFNVRGDHRYGGFSGSDFDFVRSPGTNQPPLSSLHSPHCSAAQVKSKDDKYKLFGIPLNSNPIASEVVASDRSTAEEPNKNPFVLQQTHSFGPDNNKYEESKAEKLMKSLPAGNDAEKQSTWSSVPKEVQRKSQGSSSRSSTKVHKPGIALGRSVDLSKVNSYDELIAKLDRLFDFNGELLSSNKNWLVVYTDDEDDMMLVGDDPWQDGLYHLHFFLLFFFGILQVTYKFNTIYMQGVLQHG